MYFSQDNDNDHRNNKTLLTGKKPHANETYDLTQ